MQSGDFGQFLRSVSWQWVVSYLGFIGPSCPLENLITSSKVVGKGMQSRGSFQAGVFRQA